MRAWIFSLDESRLGKIVALALFVSLAQSGSAGSGLAQSGLAQSGPAQAAPAVPSATVPPASIIPPQTVKPVAKARVASTKPDTRSEWSKLTPAQQQALQPLAADWSKLDTFRKEKWLELANRFASMGPEEKSRMQERMRDWVKLSPEQRRLARESFTRAKKLDAGQKSRQWEQYQQLPEEKRKQLAESAVQPKKAIVNPPRRADLAPAQVRTPFPRSVPAKQPVPTAEAYQSVVPSPSPTP